MRVLEVTLLYGLVGAGCACARMAIGRGEARGPRVADAILLLIFWPLYAPFLLLTATPVPRLAGRAGAGDAPAQLRARTARELDGLARALDRLRGQADPETWAELRTRLDVLSELNDEGQRLEESTCPPS